MLEAELIAGNELIAGAEHTSKIPVDLSANATTALQNGPNAEIALQNESHAIPNVQSDSERAQNSKIGSDSIAPRVLQDAQIAKIARQNDSFAIRDAQKNSMAETGKNAPLNVQNGSGKLEDLQN